MNDPSKLGLSATMQARASGRWFNDASEHFIEDPTEITPLTVLR